MLVGESYDVYLVFFRGGKCESNSGGSKTVKLIIGSDPTHPMFAWVKISCVKMSPTMGTQLAQHNPTSPLFLSMSHLCNQINTSRDYPNTERHLNFPLFKIFKHSCSFF